MTRKNSKYEAAKDFKAGVAKALFNADPPANTSLGLFDWSDQSQIFMAGYEYGIDIKPAMRKSMNSTLVSHDVEKIFVVKTQEIETELLRLITETNHDI